MQFDKYATTVIEFTRFNAEAFGESYDTLGDHFTSYSIQANSTWPMFTLPDLHVHGQNVLEQTMSLGFFATHYVDADKKLAWEKYTTENGDWYGKPFVPFIHHLNDSQPDPNIGTGPWGPIWECYPPPIFPVMNCKSCNIHFLFSHAKLPFTEFSNVVVAQMTFSLISPMQSLSSS